MQQDQDGVMPSLVRAQVIAAMTDVINRKVTRIYIRSMHKDRAREIAEAALTAIEALGLEINQAGTQVGSASS